MCLPILTLNCLRSYKTSSHVFLANIDPVLQLKVLSQIQNPIFIGMDSMNYWIQSKKEDLLSVMKKVNIVFVNETEAKMLTNETNTITAIKKVADLGPEYVVVKRGEYGSTLYSKQYGFFQCRICCLLRLSLIQQARAIVLPGVFSDTCLKM
jgi:hydroxymethylpyrimidine/phosphomethylpyrimidine kinase